MAHAGGGAGEGGPRRSNARRHEPLRPPGRGAVRPSGAHDPPRRDGVRLVTGTSGWRAVAAWPDHHAPSLRDRTDRPWRARPRGDEFPASRSVNLMEILSVLPDAEISREADAARPRISRVVHDSRAARPGDLFVAIRGERVDGRAHAAEAVERGAVAVVSDRPAPKDVPASVPWVRVPSPRRALGQIAAKLAGNPSEKLLLAGVTGTNGKTTTAV